MMTILRAGLHATLGAVGFLSVLTVLLDSRFPAFEMLSNFRPHAFLAVMLVLPALALVRLWAELAAMSLVALLLGVAVMPYLWTNENPIPEGAETASFLQYNVLFTNNDTDAIAQVVLDADADVVALHELTTTQWVELQHTMADRYPHQLALASSLQPGMSRGGGKALLSKTPLTDVKTGFDFELDGTFTPPLAATTVVNGREVLAVAMHPSPSRTGAKRIYERQAKLRSVAALIESYDGPAVIIADLNIAPTSPRYHAFLDQLGWEDPRRTVGIEATYNVRGKRALGLAIDHIFVSPELQVHDYDVGARGGSDHSSLVATVSWASS